MTLVSPGKPALTRSFGVSCEVEDQKETLYTCPPQCRAEVTMVYVVNANGTTTTANGYWYDSSADEEYSIIGGKNLGQGEFILLVEATLVLEPGDELRVTPSGNATPDLDAMCTVTETFRPVG